MKILFACQKCGYKETYTIENEADLTLAGTAFGERHMAQEHLEMYDEIHEAKLRVVQRYVKLYEADTGIEIPITTTIDIG